MLGLRTLYHQYKNHISGVIALLLPGMLTALLLFLISSNRLLPYNIDCTVFTLNIIQLYMLGITIVKYAIDQVVISRLTGNGTTELKHFFVKRVLPLSLLFAAVITIMHGFMQGLFFLISLPLEVYIIVVAVELSVQKKYWHSTMLKILGYPFFLVLIYFADKLNHVSPRTILILFLGTVVLRLLLATRFRHSGAKESVAILSYQIPLQQISNFLVFRADQLIIASGLSLYWMKDLNLTGTYLFYAKFPEAAAGIVVALAPILYPHFSQKINRSMLTGKLFWFITIGILLIQVLVSLFIFKPSQIHTDGWLFLPFCINSALMLPVHMIIYKLIEEAKIASINFINMLSLILGLVILLLSFMYDSVYIFSYIVPGQLSFIVLLYFLGRFRVKKYQVHPNPEV